MSTSLLQRQPSRPRAVSPKLWLGDSRKTVTTKRPDRPTTRQRFIEKMKERWRIIVVIPLFISVCITYGYFLTEIDYWLLKGLGYFFAITLFCALLQARYVLLAILDEDRSTIKYLDRDVAEQSEKIDRHDATIRGHATMLERISTRCLNKDLFAVVRDLGRNACVYEVGTPNLNLVILAGPELTLVKTGDKLNSPLIAQLDVRGSRPLNLHLELMHGLQVEIFRVADGETTYRFFDVMSKSHVLLTNLLRGDVIQVGNSWLVVHFLVDDAHAETVRAKDSPETYYAALPGRVTRAVVTTTSRELEPVAPGAKTPTAASVFVAPDR